MTKAAESIQWSVFIENLHHLPIKNQVFLDLAIQKESYRRKNLSSKTQRYEILAVHISVYILFVVFPRFCRAFS